jgi:hypothetical protein
MSGPLPPECAGVAPSLVELALGVLAGEERVRAVAHVEACSACSALVSELSAAADELLHLAPGVEPPVGFEARVFERLGVRHRSRGPALLKRFDPARPLSQGGRPGAEGAMAPRAEGAMGPRAEGASAARAARAGARWAHGIGLHGWRPLRVAGVLVAAAAVFAGGVLAGGVLAGHQPPSGQPSAQPSAQVGAAPSALETVALRSGSEAVGSVMVYAGNPTWVFIYMDNAAWTGELRCQVVEYQGPALTLGEFWLSGGRGAWAARVAEPAGRLKEARIVDSRGHVLAVAHLS